jgi:hypothetical protein
MRLSPETLARPRPQRLPENYQMELPLPAPSPPPRVITCRFCHSVHMNQADFLACREANT